MNIKNREIYIITYYNPPNRKEIEKNLFEYIENNYKNYIICGDLNAKHIDFGCKINNKNGIISNEFINSFKAIILMKILIKKMNLHKLEKIAIINKFLTSLSVQVAYIHLLVNEELILSQDYTATIFQ